LNECDIILKISSNIIRVIVNFWIELITVREITIPGNDKLRKKK